MIKNKPLTASAIILRADGGPNIGGGHIMRARVISAALKKIGCQVHLLVKDNDWVRKALVDFEGKVQYLKPADNESLIVLQTAKRVEARIVILDVQDTSPDYVRYLQEAASVVTIDDEGRGADIADATFRGGAFPRRDGNCYYGPPFAILPPEILEQRMRSAAPQSVKSIVCFFGTFDPKGHWKFIPKLAERFPGISFRWFTTAERPPRGNLQILRPSQAEFFEHLLSADLALIAGGVTLFETAALGRPAVVLPEAPHETEQAKLFAAAGAVVLMETPDLDRLSAVVTDLAGNAAKLANMQAQSLKLVDGRGLLRFVEVVLKLLNKSAAHEA